MKKILGIFLITLILVCSGLGAEAKTMSFKDVKEGDWYYEYVLDVYEKGLMKGYTETFGSANTLTRAQFVTVLWNMTGCPRIAYDGRFPDVYKGAYYETAVAWAAKAGIVTGNLTTGCFNPANSITREQVAVMLNRYAAYRGVDVSERESLDRFPDKANVASYAVDAMQWCVAEGIINGSGLTGELMPKGNTTRAVCATMISRFTKEVVDLMETPPVSQQYAEAEEWFADVFDEAGSKKTKPVVHIFTKDNEDILSKEIYTESVVDVFNCDEDDRLTAEGGVKVRGNSSALSDEKPYRIKFNKKQNMLGLHEGEKYKNWVLLKTEWSLSRNYMAFHLAEAIFQGEYYASDCTFVNLYINGKYKGVYLLAEQNEVSDGRVDIYEPDEDETQKEIGYFLEIDNYAGQDPSEPYFTLDYGKHTFTDYVGTTRKFDSNGYTIKSDTFSEEQREFIYQYVKGVFEIAYQAISNNKAYIFDSSYELVETEEVTPEEAVRMVMDVDSVVNFMILEELVHNYDVGEGSFYMAVDFSEESTCEKLTFTAPWDFDWAFEGSAEGHYYAGAFQEFTADGLDRSNVWLTLFMKADWFREEVQDKWEVLQAEQTLQNVVQVVREEVVTLENDLENLSWRVDRGLDVADFVEDRIAWLGEQWKK